MLPLPIVFSTRSNWVENAGINGQPAATNGVTPSCCGRMAVVNVMLPPWNTPPETALSSLHAARQMTKNIAMTGIDSRFDERGRLAIEHSLTVFRGLRAGGRPAATHPAMLFDRFGSAQDHGNDV